MTPLSIVLYDVYVKEFYLTRGVPLLLEKTTHINSLFDFYRSLLTVKQKEYMEMYYWEDFSLGEISEAVQVSRQAVYDNIKRTEKVLMSYEERLKLFKTFTLRKQLITKLEEAILNDEKSMSMKWIKQLKEMD